MNRVIKFRGKTLNSHFYKIDGSYEIPAGTFVYGNLVTDCNERPYIDIQKYGAQGGRVHYQYLIDKDTIGQFTGLHDKNGKEIYEFDVVKNKWGGIGPIVFFNGGWAIEWGEDETHILFYELDDDIEVIGNKFDNPELLNDENQ